MATILMISKPVEPPWNDGSKTLVRDLVSSMERHVPIVMATRGSSFHPPRAKVERTFGPHARGHALPPREALRVLARVAIGEGDLAHFFFQPNPRTSVVAKALSRARRRPTVHTVSSAPRDDLDARRVLFADRTVVLSRHTETRVRDAGVRGVVRIPPAVAPIDVPGDEARAATREGLELPRDAPLIVFPGDLERGEGARHLIESLVTLRDAVLALAYRQKSERSREAERALRARAEALGVASRVRWIGETPHILALLGAADVVALPTRDLGAKVDLPLVLIEAMWQARPVIVASRCAAEELAEDGAALAIEPTLDALVDALRRWLDDASARASIGARARHAAERRHHPRAMAAAYESLYDEVLR
ncbi:Glycosyltransferase [Sandaracinus amylolyticus]|nr:Glycosyltransferase [Sandaracinus amylolyticus]